MPSTLSGHEFKPYVRWDKTQRLVYVVVSECTCRKQYTALSNVSFDRARISNYQKQLRHVDDLMRAERQRKAEQAYRDSLTPEELQAYYDTLLSHGVRV